MAGCFTPGVQGVALIEKGWTASASETSRLTKLVIIHIKYFRNPSTVFVVGQNIRQKESS
jgi:hypothetical protein